MIIGVINRDSSIGKVVNYGPGDWNPIPDRGRDSFLLHFTQNEFGTHPSSFSKGTGSSFFGGKGARRRSRPLMYT
jgi:hypothetical protein